MLAPWKKSYDKPRQCIKKQPKEVLIVKAMVFPVVMYRCESWTIKKAARQGIDALELRCCRRFLNILWKDWCWSWSSNILATWCKELTYWERPWCWERLKAGGEGDGRGWDGWMASPTQWTWVWATLEAGDRQGSLVCCSPWGCKDSDPTEQLNWTERKGRKHGSSHPNPTHLSTPNPLTLWASLIRWNQLA